MIGLLASSVIRIGLSDCVDSAHLCVHSVLLGQGT